MGEKQPRTSLAYFFFLFYGHRESNFPFLVNIVPLFIAEWTLQRSPLMAHSWAIKTMRGKRGCEIYLLLLFSVLSIYHPSPPQLRYPQIPSSSLNGFKTTHKINTKRQVYIHKNKKKTRASWEIYSLTYGLEVFDLRVQETRSHTCAAGQRERDEWVSANGHSESMLVSKLAVTAAVMEYLGYWSEQKKFYITIQVIWFEVYP